MNTKEMRKLALLGIAAGVISMSNTAELQATLDANIIDMDYVIAKPKCEAHGGCGGLTAYRTTPVNSAYADKDDEGDDNSEDDYEDLDDEPAFGPNLA